MTTPVQLVFFEVTGNYVAIADPSISGVINSPVLNPVNGQVTFTPRLGGQGRVFDIDNYLITAAYNAEQTVNLINNPTSGNFTLQYGTDNPVSIAYNASASAAQAALAASPSIGTGNVLVTTPQPQSYNVEFTGTLGGMEIPVLVGDASGLSNAQGPGFCEVTVTATSQGGPQVVADTAIALSPLIAGIVNGVLCAIDRTDTPGFQLPSNMTEFGLVELIYDVSFSSITYNNGPGTLAPFAFVAPTDTTPVCITDPALARLAYQPPAANVWSPSGGAMQLSQVPGWRRGIVA